MNYRIVLDDGTMPLRETVGGAKGSGWEGSFGFF